MKNISKKIGLLFATFFVLVPLLTHAASLLPAPTNYINDYAEVLSADQEAELNSELKSFEDTTTNQIFVAIIRSLNGSDIESYAGQVFKEWKIGQKGKDNGILLLASIDDNIRRIEIGYGLEGSLTDGQAGTIIRDTIKPEFLKGDYYAGIKNGVSLIQKQIAGEIELPSQTQSSSNNEGWGNWVAFLLILGFQILAGITAWLAKSKAWWHGGVLGAGIGVVIGVVMQAIFVAVIATAFFSIIGLVIDYALSKAYKPGTLKPKNNHWFWGGGGGFGGSGGFGGGFGGGGGGSSGGGGASG